MVKEIYLIRHGETDFNKNGIVQGSGVNTSLNAAGKAQALAFFKQYQHLHFDYVFTSDLKRTHETVQHFINKGITWRIRSEIREICWGKHEGKPSSPEMREEYSNLIAAWQSRNFDARLEGGESAAEMRLRLSKFVDELKKTPFQRVLVCSHGRAMRCLMTILNGTPLEAMEQFHHLNTGLYKVDLIGDTFFVKINNDITHLK